MTLVGHALTCSTDMLVFGYQSQHCKNTLLAEIVDTLHKALAQMRTEAFESSRLLVATELFWYTE